MAPVFVGAAPRREGLHNVAEARTMRDFEFNGDEQLQDAVVRNIEIIGEAARNIATQAPDYTAKHPEVPWVAFYAMRNRVGHGIASKLIVAFSLDYWIFARRPNLPV